MNEKRNVNIEEYRSDENSEIGHLHNDRKRNKFSQMLPLVKGESRSSNILDFVLCGLLILWSFSYLTHYLRTLH